MTEAAKILRKQSPDFLQRYNRSGPRYTSYPTVPEWDTDVDAEQYLLKIFNPEEPQKNSPLSLYFHIPFCEHRCRFCGCNSIITSKPEVVNYYLQSLDHEMAFVARKMESIGSPSRPVTQIHLGGGTPTYLSPGQFQTLMQQIRSYFQISSEAEISLEADPCVTSINHIQTLASIGFNRISLGVQDFYLPTQEAIERVQSVELTQQLTEASRQWNFKSVNYDLVYGLPFQTEETFKYTLDEVIRLKPDRIAFYNFAYLPQRLPHQRSLNPDSLPSGPDKFKVFASAYECFLGNDYQLIGMDHFATSKDPLSRARREGTLQRNFMGYTTQAGTDLYAFGVSSISATRNIYVQNTKKLSLYHKAIQEGALPIERGIEISEDDRIRRDVINALMCYGRIEKEKISSTYKIDFDEYFSNELSHLPDFENDGLIKRFPDRIELTLLGNVFVRNIAMVFDRYLQKSKTQPLYSKTL